MKPDPSPTESETILSGALQATPPVDATSAEERQNRVKKAFRAQSAAHDVGDFMFGRLMEALGKVLLGLWHLVTGSTHHKDHMKNPATRDDDENS